MWITVEPLITHFDICETCQQIETTKGSRELFLKSLSVWINKPHVVNRRLCGSKIVHLHSSQSKENAYETIASFVAELHNANTADVEKVPESKIDFSDLSKELNPVTVIVRELIPKSEFFPKLLEAIIYDKEATSVSFIPLGQDCSGASGELQPTSELQYTVTFKDADKDGSPATGVNKMELVWSCDHLEDTEPRRQMMSKWLRSVLLEKLVSWSYVSDISTSVTSLQLVEVDKYKDTYVRLKNTYGRDLVKNWTERTDPKKYVYEDIAIAAYLLLIWEEDCRLKNLKQKQSFVDLGCGNGLLVYILTKEGHKGLGIDLRRRKIWDTFGPDIHLREETISPSADHLYPEYDWIIGNHSDELTPWIPVIAARSSYNCCFFLLPCCHHDFVGKFGLSEKGKSRYATYLDYVKQIVANCGFRPVCDTLRIPSTKRICFLGRERSYSKQSEDKAEKARQAFIGKRTAHCHHLHQQKNKKSYSPASQLSCLENEDLLADKDAVTFDLSLRKYIESSEQCKKSCVLTDVSDIGLIYKVSDQQDGALSGQDCKGEGYDDLHKTCTNSSDLMKLPAKPNSHSSEILSPDEPVKVLFSSDSGYEEIAEGVSSQSSETIFSYDSQKRSLDTDCDYYELESSSVSRKRFRSNSLKSDHYDSHVQFDLFGSMPGSFENLAYLKNGAEQVLSNVSEDFRINANKESVHEKHTVKTQKWAEGFQPRTEPGARNCQKVPEEVKEKIVKSVFQLVMDAQNGSSVDLGLGRIWRKGGCVPLDSVAKTFGKETLQKLKSECGGLQTLLRNHSHVFQVTSGIVRLRNFTAANPWEGKRPSKSQNKEGNQKQDTKKTTLCWFDAHHPDGCPRAANDCLFAHGVEELREKMSKQVIK